MTHAAAAGTAEGEAGWWLAGGRGIEVPTDGWRRLPLQPLGHRGTRASRSAKETAQGDRTQRHHTDSTGSFHVLLPLLLSGNRSAPTPGGPGDHSRPRAAGRRGEWRDRPRPRGPFAAPTHPAAPGGRAPPPTP